MVNAAYRPTVLTLSMETRLIDLEIRYTHLERQLEEMNKVLFAQQRALGSLEKQLELVRARLGDLGDDVANEPPPHY